MARGRKGSDVALEGNVTADYGTRAAMALDRLVPGPHRDKTVARMFGVSVRMAKYLRAGQHWTADRMTQASAALGVAFDAALYAPVSSDRHGVEVGEIESRLARLEAWCVAMDNGGYARLAQAQGQLPVEAGRDVFRVESIQKGETSSARVGEVATALRARRG